MNDERWKRPEDQKESKPQPSPKPKRKDRSLMYYLAPFVVIVLAVTLVIGFCIFGALVRGYEPSYALKIGGIAWTLLMLLFLINMIGRELYAYISAFMWIVILLGLTIYGFLLMSNAPLPQIILVY